MGFWENIVVEVAEINSESNSLPQMKQFPLEIMISSDILLFSLLIT